MAMYLNDHDDKFPDLSNAADVATKLKPYYNDPTLEAAAASYKWNTSLSGVLADDVHDTTKAWLFYTPMPDAGNKFDLEFVDTSTKRVQEDQLRSIVSAPTQIDKEEPASAPP